VTVNMTVNCAFVVDIAQLTTWSSLQTVRCAIVLEISATMR
jgi:hypothetical protein